MPCFATQITAEVLDALKCLWDEQAIRHILSNKGEAGAETTPYFMTNIDKICAEGYVPDYNDIMMLHYRNTGIESSTYEVSEDVLFHVYDTGGQRSERKKWIHCYENLTMIIFVASLHHYDMVLYEDYDANAMVDSIELFEQIVNNQSFKGHDIILFLNKKDLFAEKIKTKPITECSLLSEFNGDTMDYEETSKYIKDVFERQNKDESKQIHTFFTNAIDKEFEKILSECVNVIIQHNVKLKSDNLV